MRIIATTDFLGEKRILEPLQKTVRKKDPDVFLFMGGMCRGESHIKEIEDAMKAGREPNKTKEALIEERKKKNEDIIQFVDFLKTLNLPCLIVPGRTDSPVPMYENILSEHISHPNLHLIHLKYVQLGGFLFSGCGGLIADDNEHYFEYRIDKDSVRDSMKNLRSFGQEKILLFHTPFESTSEDGTVTGSMCVNEIIKYLEPKILFYGMTPPEEKMKIIGDCVTVNPGPLAEGNYALMNTKTMNVEFKKLEVG